MRKTAGSLLPFIFFLLCSAPVFADDASLSFFPPELKPLIRAGVYTPNIKQLPSKTALESPTTESQMPKGQEILARVAQTYSNQQFLNYDFTLHYTINQEVKSSLQGTLARLYSSAINSGLPKEQLFRELISITNPAPLRGYSWLTFRFNIQESDLVWVYSPLTQKERSIASTMRDGSLFYSTLSATVLMGFSGKPEQYNARVIEKKEYLAPLSISRFTTNSSNLQHGCIAPFPLENAAPLISRKLWKLELMNKDPYSDAARIITYIDVDTNLPVYLFEFSNNRQPLRSTISTFAVLEPETPGAAIQFAPHSAIAIDRSLSKGTHIEFTGGQICSSIPSGWSLKNFDPASL